MLLKLLTKISTQNKSRTAISVTGAVFILLYALYDKVARPPRSLRHLPTVPFWAFFRAFIGQEHRSVMAQKLTLPAAALSPQGLYTRCDQSGWTVHVAGPRAAKRILFSKEFPKVDMVGKRKGMLHGEFFVGPNILFLTGDDYKRHRRLANLAFSGSMPLELFGQMTRKMFDWIDVNGKTEIYNLANKMTLDIIGKVAFGFDFNALDKNSSSFVDKYYSVMDSVTEQPFFFLLPFLERKFLWMFPRRKQAHQDLKDLLHLLNEIIEEKRKQVREQGASTLPDKDKDLLTLMLESEMGRSGVGLSNEELRSNMCAFFLAGHDSTAVSISAVVYYLALHQDIQRKAREEAIGVLGDDGKDTIPTLEQTKKFAYIDMIIKESLRLRPPVPMGVSRVAQEDCDIDGVFLPKGTLFQLDYWEIQHSPQVWKDPKAFRPERFAPGGEAEQQDGIAWLPFSAGPRACLGQNMSLNEQRVALPMLLKKYEWYLPDDSIHKDGLVIKGVGTTLPKDSMTVCFKRRSNSTT